MVEPSTGELTEGAVGASLAVFRKNEVGAENSPVVYRSDAADHQKYSVFSLSFVSISHSVVPSEPFATAVVRATSVDIPLSANTSNV